MPDVMVLMGSRSELDIALRCVEVLDAFGVTWELHVASAHRAPDDLESHVQAPGTKVFVAIAGAAPALPGAIACKTARPVIGVPVSGKVPLDPLLSLVQAPTGVPIATVGVDLGENAGHLAVQMLGIGDDSIADLITKQRAEAADKVRNEDASVQPRQ